MDFLDSVDWDASKYKKSRRVRSWYLYEQFKSLERNQLDATRKLKNRASQDKILKQELSERKARRKLYDQFGQCTSESGIDSSVHSESTITSLNANIDDFLESFHELQEEDELTKMAVQDMLDGCSQTNLKQHEKLYTEDFRSADKPTDNYSETESVVSVVNVKSDENISEDVKKYLESEQVIKLEDMELNFDEVDEKLQRLERLALMTKDFDKLSDNDDRQYSIPNEDKELAQLLKHEHINTPDNNINLMWSKLVSFAYQIMELNHGNCYYDYGSQLLTAVLACDVLRRGINRICHILQHYVSPIKFAADSPVESQHVNRENPQTSKHCKRKRNTKMSYQNNRALMQYCRCYRSKNYWDLNYLPNFIGTNVPKTKKERQKSEPWPSSPKPKQLVFNVRNPASKSSYHTIGSNVSIDNIKQRRSGRRDILNPMCRISRRLDTLLNDIDHFVY